MEIKDASRKIKEIKRNVKKGLIGQDEVLDNVIKCLLCEGHCLLEGVPGIAKTFMARLLIETIEGAVFKRIQFTPDLLPSDILGTVIYREEISDFEVYKGPIFANIVLADEINRTPPKVQSAMLEAMQERQVTIGKQTYPLPKPFFVIATQNPLEQQGVYPLSEAQKDRFLFKIFVDYPKVLEEIEIIDTNANVKKIEELGIEKVITTEEISGIQKMVKSIKVSDEVKEYIINLVDATRNPENYGLVEEKKYIRLGASPRASIFLALAARANALFRGRDFVIPLDVKEIAPHVLRHRIILTYDALAVNISTDDIIKKILKNVKVV